MTAAGALRTPFGLPVTVEGCRARVALADYSLASYRHFLTVKGVLPRVEVDARARTLAFHVSDLAKLGVDVRALAGGWEDDGTPLYPDQRFVLDVALRRRKFAVFARCGWGKALRFSEPVLTPGGWRPIGSLAVGDEVFGVDGRPHPVTGVYPQGRRQLYRVTFSDGATVDCDAEHLWQVRRGGAPARWKVKTLREIMADGPLVDAVGRRRHLIPVAAPIELPAADLPLDPYTLGVLIGDGGISQIVPFLTTDDCVVESLVLPAEVNAVRAEDAGPGVGTYRLTGRGKGYKNPLTEALRALGLHGCLSVEKFVPESYARASVAQRFALLQGLLDTDGYCDPETHKVEFATSSPRLADDVTALVRSLGGVAHRYEKPSPTYAHKGEQRVGLPAVRLLVKLPASLGCPFRLPRKAASWVPRTKYQPVRGIERIEPVGEDEAVCISVDAPDSLFVTKDYVVTHNTTVFLAWARAVFVRTGRKVLVVVPLSVLRQTIAEHEKFWPGATLPVNLREFPGGLDAWLADDAAWPLAVVNTDAFRKPRDLSSLGGVVLDESSSIKQAGGVLWRNITTCFRGIEYRLFCTATPAPNEVREYAAQALGVGAIDAHKEFFADFFDNAEDMGWTLRPHAKGAFYAFMASWSIWIRDPSTYGFPARCKPIPEPRFVDVEVPLTPAQEAEARAIRAAGTRKGQVSLFHEDVGIATQTKLSQVSRGFVYEGTSVRAIPSHKPEAIADAVARHAAGGERAVVWVQFNEESRLITEALRARGLRVFEVTAETDDAAQFAAVEAINAGTLDALVAKPSTMGFGVNLQGASVCVFSGITHSFEQDHQAFSRVYRDGQERSVTCYYAVTALEQGMLDNVRAKRRAWLGDAEEMERAYLAAMTADLEAYRGAATQGAQRTRHVLTGADRAALAALSPWATTTTTANDDGGHGE